MFGSRVTLRLAAGVPHVRTRAHVSAGPLLQLRAGSLSPGLALASQRAYATPGRPKKAVGEPSKTLKRAVKPAATGDGRALKARATKPKSSAKPKKPAKPLTEEQKVKSAQRTAARLRKAEISELKKLALREPANLNARPLSTWIFFNAEKARVKLQGRSGAGHAALGESTRENSRDYKNLSSSELERYNHLTNEANKQRLQDYQAWIQSHTADQIRLANQARKRLGAKLDAKKGKYSPLVDDRLVRQPITSYMFFNRERMTSGDFRNIKVDGSTGRLIGDEWKALSQGEKQKYLDLAAQDSERYYREYKEVYGHTPPYAGKTKEIKSS